MVIFHSYVSLPQGNPLPKYGVIGFHPSRMVILYTPHAAM